MSKIVFVDCGVSQSETPDRIVQRLQEEEGLEVIRNPRSTPSDYSLIRWGATRFSELDRLTDSVLNRSDAIAFNIRKDLAHKKMLEAGVSSPLMWSTFQEARRQSRELGCDFLRRKKHHTQGKDILRVKPTDHLPHNRRHGYYTQLLEKTAEFRLHIFQDRCIGIAQKVKREGDTPNPLIWNFENGWDLVYTPREEREAAIPHYREMVAESSKAVKALSLDFGAVDLIMVGAKPYILEVNTAPKLAQTKRYSKAFIQWIGEQE
jgi:glutathione synthase/RimK-type ligase-like ATP-grasp enzyme